MKILVVVDAQVDFITGKLGSEEAQKVLPNIVNKIHDADNIVLTVDTHYSNYLETQEGKNLPVEHCIIDTDGFEIHPDIIEAMGEKYRMAVFKNTFGSRHLPTSLEQYAISHGYIEEIELVGYVLDICVISNALLLKAFFTETPIKVDVSCCAATSPENRDAAIKMLKSCQIEVLNEEVRV